MKKNFILFMCLLAAFSLPVLTSCGDDDDDDSVSGSSSTSPKKMIVGTWKADKEYSAYVNQYELVFNSDGSGSEHCWYFDEYGTNHEVGKESFTYEIEVNSNTGFDWTTMTYTYDEDYTLYFTWKNDVATKYKDENWLFEYDILGYELYFENSNHMSIAYEGFTRE